MFSFTLFVIHIVLSAAHRSQVYQKTRNKLTFIDHAQLICSPLTDDILKVINIT
jgi:hypothetical protein